MNRNGAYGALLLAFVAAACGSDNNTFGTTGTGGSSGTGGAGGSTQGGGGNGTGPGAGGNGATSSTPIFTRAACDSLAASDLVPTTTQTAGTAFAVGQLVGGRIDPDSLMNQEHRWSVQLTPGWYHAVIDSKRSDGKSSNVGLDVEMMSPTGTKKDILHANEIAMRTREHGFFEITAAGDYQLKVTANFGMEDYTLGVFANGTAVPSPFFAECPTVTPMTLGEPASFMVGGSNAEQWLSIDLPAGDYVIASNSRQMDGKDTNLSYAIDFLDRFGQDERAKQVLWVNEITVTDESMGMHVVGEATSYWVRLNNSHHPLEVTLTISAK
jgi:hypothetical protein